MFKSNNREGFYRNEVDEPKLSKTEILFFGLLSSGAIKLDVVPMPTEADERCFIDTNDPDVMAPLNHDLELLADLYEHCRRYVGRKQSSER